MKCGCHWMCSHLLCSHTAPQQCHAGLTPIGALQRSDDRKRASAGLTSMTALSQTRMQAQATGAGGARPILPQPSRLLE